MSNTARNHHYLPQSYLKGFTMGGEKNSKLHVIDMVEKKQFKTRPRNIGAQRDFNRVEVEGLDPNAVESTMSPFENDVSRVIEWIDKNETLPVDEDLAVIMNFIALLGVRNPKIRETFQGFQKEVLKKLSMTVVSSPEIWGNQMEKIREHGYSGPELSYEEMREFIKEERYDISFTPGYNLMLELQSIEAILPFLYERKWILLVAKDNAGNFVSSDRPVAIMPTSQQSARMPIGFGIRDTDLTIPLNKRLALSGKFEGDSFVLPVDLPMVAALNMHTIHFADRFIYSPTKKFMYFGDNGFKSSEALL